MIVLFLFFAFFLRAQAPVQIYISTTVPVGACNPRSFPILNPTTGALYVCKAGTWANIAGGGGGGSGVGSVAFSTNLGTVTGSPITTAGTITDTVSAAQVVGLFSTCSGTQYLGADGACHSAGSGTLTTISGSGPSWLTWTITNPTTTPVILLAPTTGETSHQVIGTCGSATTFGPCSLVAGDIPALPYVPTTRNINTTSPLSGGGDLSADRTIACATCTTNASALTSNLPVIGAGGNAIAVGTRSGNTTDYATVSGSLTSGHCTAADANGNVVDSGFVCSGGTGTAAANGPCLQIGANNYILPFMSAATTLPSFTWANQGTATVTAWGCGEKLYDGTYPGSNQARVRYSSAPGAHFTVIGAVAVTNGVAGGNSGVAICMYETGTGKVLGYTVSPDWGDGFIRSSGTAAVLSSEVGCCGVTPAFRAGSVRDWTWFKMVYDGTNVSTYINVVDPSDTNQWRLVEAALTASTYFTTAPDAGCYMIADKANPISITGSIGSFQMTTP